MAHPEQLIAADNILGVFLQKHLRFAILVARCQAGKTGAFQSLIGKMLLNGDINRAYILCGSNETELRSQAHADAKEANPMAYASGTLKIFFRQDFKSGDMDITRALIIVDESHMDQTQKQELDQFLSRHDLSLDGNPKTLIDNDAYIVSVDATPYSELSALLHKESHEKHVEILASGEGYFGIENYLEEGKIKSTYDISCNSREFERIVRSSGPKYGLMRITTGKNAAKQEKSAANIYRRIGGKVVFYTSDKTEIAITSAQKVELKLSLCLDDVPDVPTLVIIRGRLRAGKVVPKQHIAFVWEGANMSKTDALVQGLLGRMCGYVFGAEKPLIFVPASALKRNEKKVVQESEIQRAIMPYIDALPRVGTNLKKGCVANVAENGKTQCPPLRLTWERQTFTEEFDEKFSRGADRTEIQKACFALLAQNLDAIRENPNFSDQQKTEILDKILPAGSDKSHIRNFHGDSQMTYFKQIYKAHKSRTASSEHAAGCNPLNFLITYRGYKAPHANHHHVYVIFYTDATHGEMPGIKAVDLKSRIPQTNGKSVFSIHDSQFDKPLVAGGILGFDKSKLKTPEILEATLREYIQTYKQAHHLTVSRCIQHNKDRFALDKKKFHWKSNTDNDLEKMCMVLERDFDIRIQIKYVSARGFNVDSIEW
jgi:hypothetical protein